MSDVTPPPAPTPPAAAPYAAAPTAPKTNPHAIVSLVLAFFVSLGAVICGHIALGQIKKTGENGRGLAIAGLVLGYLGLVGGLIATIVWVSFFAIAASNGVTFAP